MRCKACDAVLQPAEIIWREEIKAHEDLCRRCRGEVAVLDELPLTYYDDLFEEEDGTFE